MWTHGTIQEYDDVATMTTCIEYKQSKPNASLLEIQDMSKRQKDTKYEMIWTMKKM